MTRPRLPRRQPDVREHVRQLPRPLRIAMRIVTALVALVCIAGIALCGLWGWSLTSSHAANERLFGRALAGFGDQYALTRTWPEPWRSPYNIGTARLMAGRTDEGVDRLTEAFRLVPTADRHTIDGTDYIVNVNSPECLVRINLSIGIERQGDALAAAGDTGGATASYAQAARMSQPCAGPSGANTDRGQQAHDAHDRQSSKSEQGSPLDSSTDHPTQPTSPETSPSPQNTDTGAEEQRRNKLRERNRDAHEREEQSPEESETPQLPDGRYW
ncbi:hypothetical protein H8R18_08355 [Nanchangia anserum]|uniref:Uncharacterized protein n=1 Tax=Nanchangia anserum TaxID=2692125 RepID=A0A8I0KW16_9ACTO|nr:hypothetical protein [Nanchangia anserum]MBD3689529.1 hypothetical protein [Nanchangia anserum]QOX81719.1 hypothetical protein H8R18_08355 [Nanchangia anserum]